jgi:CRISPR-associated protein Cas5t
MLVLYLEAPFAVCRTFTAGWYRPTATFLTPSAAYGLLLNLGGVETRLTEENELHNVKVPATLTRAGLPKMRIALGAPTSRIVGTQPVGISEASRFPTVQTVFQQLHNYPVGNSGMERAASTFGNKYNITPVRREILCGLTAIIGCEADQDLEDRICKGLNGELPGQRYGLPFVGDNSFMPDRVVTLSSTPEAHWYERVTDEQASIRYRTTRLTIRVDRSDMSKTVSELFAPSNPASTVPPNAWTEIRALD